MPVLCIPTIATMSLHHATPTAAEPPSALQATEQESHPLKPLDDPLSHYTSLSSHYSSRGLLEILQTQDTEQLLTASDFMRSTAGCTSDHAPPKAYGNAAGSPAPHPSSQSPSDSPLHLSVSSAQLDTVPTFLSAPASAAWPQPGVTLRPHAPVMPPSAAYPTRRPPSTQSPINPHYAGFSPHTASSNTSALHSTFPQSVLSHLHSVDPPQSQGTIQSTFDSAMLSSLVSNVQFDAPSTPASTTRTPTTSLPPLPNSSRSAPPSSLTSQRACDTPAHASPRAAADAHQTLAQFVDQTRGSRTAVASVAMVAAEAAFALHNLHSHACVHLHVHPHNVHLCAAEDGAASPSSAAAAGGGGFRARLCGPPTPHGMLLASPVGAPGFMPPEVAAASEDMPIPAAPAADVYGLAVLTASLLIATLDPAAQADVDPADSASLTRRLQALLNSGLLDWNLAYILENSWVEDPNLRPSAMQVARACAWVAYMHASPHAVATVADSTDEPMTSRAGEAATAADRLSDLLEQATMSQQCTVVVAEAATGAPQWLIEYITRRGNAAAAAQAVPRSSDVPAMVAAAAEARARTALGAIKRPGWAARAATASHTSSGGTPRGTPTGTPSGTPREGSGAAAALRRRAARSKRLREGAFGAAVLQDILMATLKAADPCDVPAGGSGSRRSRGSAQVGHRSMSRGQSRGRGRGRRDAGETHADRAAMKSAGAATPPRLCALVASCCTARSGWASVRSRVAEAAYACRSEQAPRATKPESVVRALAIPLRRHGNRHRGRLHAAHPLTGHIERTAALAAVHAAQHATEHATWHAAHLTVSGGEQWGDVAARAARRGGRRGGPSQHSPLAAACTVVAACSSRAGCRRGAARSALAWGDLARPPDACMAPMCFRAMLQTSLHGGGGGCRGERSWRAPLGHES